MNSYLGLTPLISLIAAIMILIVSRLLNFIVATYLIAIAIDRTFGGGRLHLVSK